MLIDNNLVFSNNQAITSTADSTNVLDALQGITENIGPNASAFGIELGFGDGPAIPKLLCIVNVAFVSAGGATLQIAWQGSTDSSSWTTYQETPTLSVANLGTIGNRVAMWDWPPRLVSTTALPRYFKLVYTVATSTFSAGKLFAAIVLQRDDKVYYPSGFSVV